MVLLIIVLFGVYVLSRDYRLLMSYYSCDAVTKMADTAGTCLNIQLGQLRTFEQILDAAKEKNPCLYMRIYGDYQECLPLDMQHMESMRTSAMHAAQNLGYENAVFRWSGYGFDPQTVDVLAYRTQSLAAVYNEYMKTLDWMIRDERLRKKHGKTYVSLLSAVIEADRKVSIGLYQLTIRQMFSLRELQYGEYSDKRMLENLTQEEWEDLIHLDEASLKAKHMHWLYLLWEAKYELDAYRNQIGQEAGYGT
ncbi:MAG: hypothetical protein E7321_01510 [Clostridiales bacterium]|nr:hypothetical protein [Clostridiales bacterium]